MKKTFTDEQIVGILRGYEASGLTVKEYCRQKDVSEQTYYKWRKRFGTMEVEELRHFKQLQQENTRLKKLLAERDLEIDVTQGSAGKKVVSVAARREIVEFIKTRKISERCGCRLIGLNRKSHRYRQRCKPDQKLIKRIRQLAMNHPRFGYRRIWALLNREGTKINLKKVYRLWKLEKLNLPKRRPRKPRAKPGVEILPKAERANQVWTYDFVFDQILSGKSLKMLTLLDEFTRECLVVEVGVSITSERVRQILERVCLEKGKPEMIRSDNGSEFIGQAFNNWLAENGIKPLFIEPGKPWQNGKGESFNGKLRDECLSWEWFSSVKEAQVVIEGWRKFYNEERPHSSLGYLTPKEFKSLAIAMG